MAVVAAAIAGLAVASFASGLGMPSPTSDPAVAGGSVPTTTESATEALPSPASPEATATGELPQPSPTAAATATPEETSRAGSTDRRRPDEAVLAFYVAVATHDWRTATALWSPDMQRRYPPDENIVDRFSATQRIHISGLRTVEVDRAAGTARVELTVIEYRKDGPSPQRFVGAWDLVRIGGRWLLDTPHF